MIRSMLLALFWVALVHLVACPFHKTKTIKPGEPPSHKSPAVWPDEAYRQQQPKPGPIRPMTLPKINSFALDNGLRVFLARESKLPIVVAYLVVDQGDAADPPNKAGRSEICTDLLTESTQQWSKAQYKAMQAELGINIFSSSQADVSFLGFTCLLPGFEKAVELLAQNIYHPGLRKKDYDRLIRAAVNDLQQQKSNPKGLSWRILDSLAWGESHPYGRLRTLSSLNSLALSDCEKNLTKFKPNGARLFISGDLSEERIRGSFGKHLADWKGNAPKPVSIPEAQPKIGTTYFSHIAGAKQSAVMVFLMGPNRTDPGYEARVIMTRILGSGVSGRLGMNLREDKGIAYGAAASVYYDRKGSLFVAYAYVQSDSTVLALREIVKEVRKMAQTDALESEIKRERDGALLALPANFATAEKTIGLISSLTVHGLSLDWYRGYQKRLKLVDISAVRQSAQALFQNERLMALVVGDRDKVLPELKSAVDKKLIGSSGLIYVDATGQPI